MTVNSENLSVRLPQDIRQQVDELARVRRRSRSFIINEAVASYVHSQAEYAKDIEAAMASVRQGVGHSSEQVFAWLDSWSEGKKLPIPKPDVLPNT
jgi:predicted transcriptional regulator